MNDFSIIHLNIKFVYHKLDHFNALLDYLHFEFDTICFNNFNELEYIEY